MDKNYYQILGLSKNATKEDIKDAFKKAALMYHPDRNQGSEEAAERFKLVNEAYQTLSNVHKKHVFDQKLYMDSLVMMPTDQYYSFKYQTSYNFDSHRANEAVAPKVKHNKEWSGTLFFISLLFVVLTGLALYFFN